MTESQGMGNLLPFVLAIIAGLGWGIGEVCTKSVLHSGKIGPMTAIAVRSVVALPLIVLAYWVAMHVLHAKRENPTWYRDLDAAAWAKLILGSGLCAGALAMVAFYAALSLGEISKIKPIAFTIAPATGVLLGWWLLREDMTWHKGVAIGLILLGVALLTAAPTKASAGGATTAASGPAH